MGFLFFWVFFWKKTQNGLRLDFIDGKSMIRFESKDSPEALTMPNCRRKWPVASNVKNVFTEIPAFDFQKLESCSFSLFCCFFFPPQKKATASSSFEAWILRGLHQLDRTLPWSKVEVIIWLIETTIIIDIWGFPKMVVPNNHGFSY